MKKVFFLFIFLLILSGFCYALTPDDNGYAWKAASSEERVVICKELSSSIGKDYTYWMELLNGFYENTNWNIVSMKIKDVAAQVPLSEK